MKRTMLLWVVVCLVSLAGAVGLTAQSGASAAPSPSAAPNPAPAPATASMLRLIKFSGSAVDAQGRPLQGTVGVTFTLYADQQGGSPLWVETQNVALNKQGRYTTLLGATQNGGLPLEIFASGEARWLGVQFQGQAEQPRVLLVAVPYALKAAEAETLSGKKASDFVTTEQLPEQVQKAMEDQQADNTTTPSASSTTTSTGTSGKTVTTSGATNFTDSTSDQVVKVTQNGTGYALLGVGTNSNGLFGATQAPNSNVYGIFGQTIGQKGGALIGFANATNGTAVGVQGVSKSAQGTAGAFVNTAGGRILLGRGAGNAQVFSVSGTGEIASHGFTVSPEVTSTTGTAPNVVAGVAGNSVTAGVAGGTISGGGDSSIPEPNLVTDDYGTVAGGFHNQAGDDAGTTSDHTYAVVSGGSNNVASGGNSTVGGGDGNTASGPSDTVAGGASNTASGGDSVVAGGFLNTASGVDGFVGGGVGNRASATHATVAGGDTNTASGYNATVPGGDQNLASGDFSFAAGHRAQAVNVGAFVWGDGVEADVSSTANNQVTFRADGGFRILDVNGTVAQVVSPGRVQLPGNVWSSNSDNRYIGFGDQGCGAGVGATVDNFCAAVGEIGGDDVLQFVGNVFKFTQRLVTNPSVTISPLASEPLTVAGDIRIGTGSTGCVKDADGTVIAGTCSSDRRLKKNIQPFAPVLGKLARLQPVHFDWRAEEFPERHFGHRRSFGLIAQDVERVLPEMVTEDQQGYKAVRYNELPLFLLEAVRELKTAKDGEEQRLQTAERELHAERAALQTVKAELAKDEVLLQQVRATLATQSHVEVASAGKTQ